VLVALIESIGEMVPIKNTEETLKLHFPIFACSEARVGVSSGNSSRISFLASGTPGIASDERPPKYTTERSGCNESPTRKPDAAYVSYSEHPNDG
jgi:hypothetical protein